MVTQERIDQVRRFERFYERYLRKRENAIVVEHFSRAGTRVIRELGLLPSGRSNAWLCGQLDLDSGYLCRVLRGLEGCGLVTSRASLEDRRAREWDLTDRGRIFATRIESEYRSHARETLIFLIPEDQRRLVDAMRTIEEILARHPSRRGFW